MEVFVFRMVFRIGINLGDVVEEGESASMGMGSILQPVWKDWPMQKVSDHPSFCKVSSQVRIFTGYQTG
jgi:hypothetical protein